MIGLSNSDPSIPLPQSEPNAQVVDALSERSSRSSRQSSEKESSLGKSRPLVRKPNTQNSNLESYKTLKRKSQEKGNLDPAPPRYPKSSQEIKQSTSTSRTEDFQQRSTLPIEQRTEEGVKFKKKPLTKQEIIEIKDYVQGLEKEESEVNSVAGTEKPIASTDIEPPLLKELNKKSKTQYFHIEDFQRHPSIDAPQSQALSESENNFIASLKLKCKSVDENNSILQKRISWLREQVQMHLQRQLNFQQMKQQLEKAVKEKEKELQAERVAHLKQKQSLKKQLSQREGEIERLKQLFIDLHNRFQDDKQILVQEIQFLKSEKQGENQQKARYDEHIKDLQATINALIQQKKQIQSNNFNAEQYSNSFVQKILSQNKYLKVENHILAKCKDEVVRLQKELKRVANERDGLKKKIIESAKRDRRRPNKQEDSDSDASSFFVLSQISVTEGSFKRN